MIVQLRSHRRSDDCMYMSLSGNCTKALPNRMFPSLDMWMESRHVLEWYQYIIFYKATLHIADVAQSYVNGSPSVEYAIPTLIPGLGTSRYVCV